MTNTRHVHTDLIIAWANGSEIECYNDTNGWQTVPQPMWLEKAMYRIKPKVIVRKFYLDVFDNELKECTAPSDCPDQHHLELTQDSETHKILTAEIL